MDSLVNYASDGENSNNSDFSKMSHGTQFEVTNGRATDANYDPVQMDMSEESNSNTSSKDFGSEQVITSTTAHSLSRGSKVQASENSSSSDSRRTENENHTIVNSKEDYKREDRVSSTKHTVDKSRRPSYDDRRHRESSQKDNNKDSKRKDEDRKSREEDRKKDRNSHGLSRDEKNDEKEKAHYHKDEKKDRIREKTDRDRRRDRDRDRDRDRRHSRDERSKDRHREERSSHHREKDRTRSRSRSRDRTQPPFRTMSYREEKGRNKLAQLEKLGIELKAPEGETIIPGVPMDSNYYNPLATATQGKYAEQIQKRKLLWANKTKPEEGKSITATGSTASTWVGTTFTHDQDGKVSAKFKRLMGIKDNLPTSPSACSGGKPDILKKQEEMFSNMEQQYEVARATTHTQRGVGLGYATGGYQFPR